jgi:hypothetical protein
VTTRISGRYNNKLLLLALVGVVEDKALSFLFEDSVCNKDDDDDDDEGVYSLVSAKLGMLFGGVVDE